MLLAHQLVDLVVEVPDLEVREAGFLDPRYFAGDFFEDLTAPFFACGDRAHGCDELGAARAAGVEDAEVGGLGGAEAEKHRLRFFAVAGLEGGGLLVWVGGWERTEGRTMAADVTVRYAVIIEEVWMSEGE